MSQHLPAQNVYIQRVNCVIDHITSHPADAHSLKTLANIAGFSEFHFHRIFKSIVGETLNQFVWRVRVAWGASLLRANHALTVSDAAIEAGFGSLAGFSRAFKTRFGIAPTQWDRQSRLQGEVVYSAETPFPTYHIEQLQTYEGRFLVQFRPMSAQRLAYIRVHDSYSDESKILAAYHRLFDWFTQRGGDLAETTLYGMSQDDPDITPREQCRFDWCLRVPNDWQGDDIVSVRDFPACLLATITMDGQSIHVEDQILQYFWRYWLPRSDYQPVNLPSMEIYRRFPHESGWWETLYMDCAIPVMRLV